MKIVKPVNEALEAVREVKENVGELQEEIGNFQKKLDRAIKITKGMKIDQKKRQRKLDKKKVKQMEKEASVNEGDISVEEVFNKLEGFKDLPQPQIKDWETNRERYKKSREVLSQNEDQIRLLEKQIDAFEDKCEALGISKEECKKFREDSNQISIWFGRYEAMLQYAASAGVVFLDTVEKNKEGLKN